MTSDGRSRPIAWASRKQSFRYIPFRVLPSSSPFIATLLIASVVALLLAPPARATEQADLLAEVEGETIRAQELEQALGLQLGQLYEQIYELKRKKLDELIVEKLLGQEAAKRGLSTQQLLDAEVTSKVGPVTEQEVQSLFQQHKAKFRGPEKVRTAYPKEVRLIYHHFPIDRLHPQARLAAQAAECAGAEGRFWEYHDRLFDQVDLPPLCSRSWPKD